MRGSRWLLLAACTVLNGCASIAAHYIETPGHHGPTDSFKQHLKKDAGYVQHNFQTAGGIRIAYWYSSPRAIAITNNTVVAHKDGKPASVTVDFKWTLPPDNQPTPATRGSVVLLQPWGQNAAQMTYWGVYFSNAGYVTVLPALRSQGDSSDAPVGYGPREACDIVQLIHALQRKDDLPAPLYLFGVSYGATVALFAAPQLSQVRGVVALEPYVHPVDVIERAPGTGWFAPTWWSHFFSSRRTLHKAIAHADKKLGIGLADIDPADALAASQACTLLLRGSDDVLISRHAVQNLATHSPRASYVEVPHEGHISLFFRSDLLFPPILAWMQGMPADVDAPCPVLAPLQAGAATHAVH